MIFDTYKLIRETNKDHAVHFGKFLAVLPDEAKMSAGAIKLAAKIWIPNFNQIIAGDDMTPSDFSIVLLEEISIGFDNYKACLVNMAAADWATNGGAYIDEKTITDFKSVMVESPGSNQFFVGQKVTNAVQQFLEEGIMYIDQGEEGDKYRLHPGVRALLKPGFDYLYPQGTRMVAGMTIPETKKKVKSMVPFFIKLG